MQHGESKLPETSRSALRAKELARLAKAETNASQRASTTLGTASRFDGKLERIIAAHQGQLALIGNDKAFVLMNLRPGMQAGLGREMTLTRKGQNVDWSIGRKRGLAR